MILPVSHENPWNSLQQPVHPSMQLKPQHRMLLSALDQGWQVAEPVYFRPRWDDQGPWVYHFILTRPVDQRQCFLSVPASDETDSLIQFEGWRVDHAGEAK